MYAACFLFLNTAIMLHFLKAWKSLVPGVYKAHLLILQSWLEHNLLNKAFLTTLREVENFLPSDNIPHLSSLLYYPFSHLSLACSLYIFYLFFYFYCLFYSSEVGILVSYIWYSLPGILFSLHKENTLSIYLLNEWKTTCIQGIL